ncbi:MAG: hypothetical protein ACOC2U_04455 [bacterium]
MEVDINNKAKYVQSVEVCDPDTNEMVEMDVYKHKNGGLFAIGSSYLEQNFESDEDIIVPDMFCDDLTIVEPLQLID